jgi:23S rRNA (guanosine2251-2'-O)-methyltransferase
MARPGGSVPSRQAAEPAQEGELVLAGANLEGLYGRNPVYEVLRAGRRRVERLLVDRNAEQRGRLKDILDLAAADSIPVRFVDKKDLGARDSNHQGVVADCSPFEYAHLPDILSQASRTGEPIFVLLLDLIQDPQNLGTLLRTAEAVGVHGVIIPPRRAAGITPAVVSASSGACEHLLVARANLTQAIMGLKQDGVWITGLEGSPEAQPAGELDLSGPIGLVIGGEGSGLRRLVRERCDFLMRIPMRGQIESLNAAVAGSIGLYAIWEARGFTGSEA